MFAGDNRPSGALLSYSVNKDTIESEAEEDEDLKVMIEIFDASGSKIRTLERTPEHNGLNRTTWGLGSCQELSDQAEHCASQMIMNPEAVMCCPVPIK
ncbi:MAG: hypothetical protein U5K71_04290 [Gracilimonas sp.]|nr:hypothetical protein [Gracilimonas sp.]